MKKADFIIRKATPKDLATLVDLRYKLDLLEHRLNPFHPKPPTKGEVRKTIKKQFKDKGYFFFIAEFNGKSIGFLALWIKRDDRTHKKRATFDAIWVEPKSRKQGVARALSEIRLNKIRQYKLEKATVYIRPENVASIRNIESLGGKHILNVYNFKLKK